MLIRTGIAALGQGYSQVVVGMALCLLPASPAFAITYSSSNTSQAGTASVNAGSANNQILRTEIVMVAGGGGQNATSITFNTTGTTSASDIQNARVWFTGSSTTFATTIQFGATVASPSGSFTVTGTQALASGNNYFWLSYDIPAGASRCNVTDAQCTSFNITAGTYTPSPTSPAGNRMIDGNMVYVSSTTTQPSSQQAYQGTPNTHILGIEIITGGTLSPLNFTSVTFSTSGTTNPAADISNARVWYGGTSNIFAAVAQFGSTVTAPSGSFTVTGTQALAGCDTNFFWLTYDMKSTATLGNYVDAQCASVTVGGTPYTPSVTAPSGYRVISNYPPYAQKKHAGGNSDYVECITIASNAIVAAGYTFSFGQGSSDVTLLQANLAGDLLWHKTFGTPSSESAEYIDQVGSGYVLAGTKNNGSQDVLLVNTDANGLLLWKQSYGQTGWGDSGYWFDAVTGGGFIIAGQMVQSGTLGDLYLVRTDGDGSFLWGRSYGGSGNAEMLLYAKEVSGGFVVGGTVTSYGAGQSDFFLARTDANGSLLWTTTYGTTSSENFVGAAATTDGGYIVTGEVSANLTAGGSGDFCLLKVDANGSFQWFKSYGGSGSDDPYWVEQTSDGGFIVGGSSSSFPTATYDFLLVKTDNTGAVQWTKGWGSSAFSTTDYISCVKQASDGSYWLSVVSGFSAGGADYGILHLDATGNTGGCYDLFATIQSQPYGLGPGGVLRNVSPTNYTVGSGATGAGIAVGAFTEAGSGPASTDVCPPTALPVSFLSFDAELIGDKALLEWETASEVNNDFFVVERSLDGISFSGIGKVQGSGQATSVMRYNYTDFLPGGSPDAYIYYRLRQVDYDGGHTYSKTVKVIVNVKEKLSIEGIHTTGGVAEVRFILPTDGETGYELLDVAGSRVLSGSLGWMKEGSNTVQIPTASQPSGIYCLLLRSSQRTAAGRMVIY